MNKAIRQYLTRGDIEELIWLLIVDDLGLSESKEMQARNTAKKIVDRFVLPATDDDHGS